MFYHNGSYMIYFAPMKYYNDKGQFTMLKVIEDFMKGELNSIELHQIEVNLQLLRPKEYRKMMKDLWKINLDLSFKEGE